MSLLASARSAVLWNTGFGLFRDLVQFAVMLVMVRLLAPEHYGQFALVTAIVGFLNVFSSVNFLAHVIQLPEGEEPDFQLHFTASLFIQGTVFLATNLAGLVCAQIETYAGVAPYLHLMSLLFVLTWPYEVRLRMLERTFSWGRLRLLQAAGLLLGAATGLGMAWAGLGTYALLVPSLIAVLPFLVDLFLVERWRPSWRFSWAAFRPAAAFAAARIGSGILGNGRQLVELSLLTALLGFAPLGIFTRAVGLAQLLCSQVAGHLGQAIYPVLARAQSRGGDQRHVGNLLVLGVLFVAVPAAVFFSIAADSVVRLLYGSQWLEVVPLLPFALALGLATALHQILYLLLLARSRPRLCLLFDAVYLGGTAAALGIALPFGTQAYLLGMATLLGGIAAAMLIVLSRAGALALGSAAASLAAALAAAAPAAGLAFAVPAALSSLALPMPALPLLILSAAAFGLAYLAAFRLLFPKRLAGLVGALPWSERLRRLCLLAPVPPPNQP